MREYGTAALSLVAIGAIFLRCAGGTVDQSGQAGSGGSAGGGGGSSGWHLDTDATVPPSIPPDPG
jgi:hypothetical protein